VMKASILRADSPQVAADDFLKFPLKFTIRDVLDRMDRLGDLFEPVLTTRQTLPAR